MSCFTRNLQLTIEIKKPWQRLWCLFLNNLPRLLSHSERWLDETALWQVGKGSERVNIHKNCKLCKICILKTKFLNYTKAHIRPQ